MIKKNSLILEKSDFVMNMTIEFLPRVAAFVFVQFLKNLIAYYVFRELSGKLKVDSESKQSTITASILPKPQTYLTAII